MIRILALLLALIATPALATSDDPSRMIPQVSAGRIVAWPSLDGGAAGRMSVWVWLPPGYDAGKRARYPVLYMHDGQNLFDKALTKFDQEWGIDEAIPRMARQGDLREWIVVGVQSPRSRYQTLFPAKLLPLLSPEFQQRVRTLDSGDPKGSFASAAYLDFLVHTVKARVDASFRTLPGRANTAVMGSSMGGLMAFYAMAEYPAVFGQAACVSMHVALASPTEKGADHQGARRRSRRRVRPLSRDVGDAPGAQPAVHRPRQQDAGRQLWALHRRAGADASSARVDRRPQLRVPHLHRRRA